MPGAAVDYCRHRSVQYRRSESQWKLIFFCGFDRAWFLWVQWVVRNSQRRHRTIHLLMFWHQTTGFVLYWLDTARWYRSALWGRQGKVWCLVCSAFVSLFLTSCFCLVWAKRLVSGDLNRRFSRYAVCVFREWQGLETAWTYEGCGITDANPPHFHGVKNAGLLLRLNGF